MRTDCNTAQEPAGRGISSILTAACAVSRENWAVSSLRTWLGGVAGCFTCGGPAAAGLGGGGAPEGGGLEVEDGLKASAGLGGLGGGVGGGGSGACGGIGGAVPLHCARTSSLLSDVLKPVQPAGAVRSDNVCGRSEEQQISQRRSGFAFMKQM